MRITGLPGQGKPLKPVGGKSMNRYLLHPFVLAILLFLWPSILPAIQAQDPAEEFKALHGTWKIIRFEEGGKQQERANAVYIFSERRCIVKVDGNTIADAEVRLDTAAHPKHLDFHVDQNRWDVTIYARCGDFLFICGSRDVKNHPKEFASGTKEGGHYMQVLKKEP
jgi:uncharacterized protein (TIGR03067 family)